MRILYVGPHYEAPPADSVYGVRTGRGRLCCVRIGNHHHLSGYVPAICISILCVLFYPPGLVGCREYSPEQFCSCFDGRMGSWYGALLGLLLCLDQTVVGPPHYSMVVWAPTPCHCIEGATYSWVAFVWAAKAVFFGGQDFGPSIIEQILACLKLQLLLP